MWSDRIQTEKRSGSDLAQPYRKLSRRLPKMHRLRGLQRTERDAATLARPSAMAVSVRSLLAAKGVREVGDHFGEQRLELCAEYDRRFFLRCEAATFTRLSFLDKIHIRAFPTEA